MDELLNGLFEGFAWLFVLAVAGVVAAALFGGRIRARGLFRTGNGRPSPARFQAFVVTVLISVWYLVQILNACGGPGADTQDVCNFPTFEEQYQAVLVVMVFGLSKLTYLTAKGFLGSIIQRLGG